MRGRHTKETHLEAGRAREGGGEMGQETEGLERGPWPPPSLLSSLQAGRSWGSRRGAEA